MTIGDIFRIILAFILPPLAVATQVGVKGVFWLNLVFWLLSFGAFGLPVMGVMWPVAVVHAIYIIVTRK
ncbi:MAG: YqaE/Pmp3 family membrane protein [Synechococcus sp.]